MPATRCRQYAPEFGFEETVRGDPLSQSLKQFYLPDPRLKRLGLARPGCRVGEGCRKDRGMSSLSLLSGASYSSPLPGALYQWWERRIKYRSIVGVVVVIFGKTLMCDRERLNSSGPVRQQVAVLEWGLKTL